MSWKRINLKGLVRSRTVPEARIESILAVRMPYGVEYDAVTKAGEMGFHFPLPVSRIETQRLIQEGGILSVTNVMSRV